MKRIYHKDLTLEHWEKFSFCEQMANIGSEVFRAMSWRQKNHEYSRLALERALELLDLTLEGVTKSGSRLKELTRLRKLWLIIFFSIMLMAPAIKVGKHILVLSIMRREITLPRCKRASSPLLIRLF